ncbi:MAG: TolC family protein [Oscillospiraceae bacterium]|nr:TolC family protein [Oscillospiraceae bacterium]
MRKKRISMVLSLCLVVAVLFQCHSYLAADATTYYQIGNAETVKTLDEALKLFEDNSPDIKQMKLQYDAKIYEYEAAKDQEEDYQELYVINVGSSDSDTLDSVREQYLSALLNREVLSFYSKNYKELVSYEVLKQKYNFISMYYKLMTLEKQEAYYTANAKYLSTCKSIANIKYRYGRCTALEVRQISAQIEENNSALYETESEQEKLSSELEDILGITVDFSVKIPVNTAATSYTLSDTISLLNKNEYSYEEALAYKDAYYVCNTCEKAVNGSTTYKKNNVSMQQYSLQADSIKKKISSYAKSTISVYSKYCKKLTATQNKLTNTETAYKNLSMKYQKGKTSKVDVLEANVNRAEAEFNYYSAVYNKELCEYVLNNSLYQESTN